MTNSTAGRDPPGARRMLIDPRHGDIEDDAASPDQRSLLAIAGSLLVEISLPKLLFAWTVSLVLAGGAARSRAVAGFSLAFNSFGTSRGPDRDRHRARCWLAIIALGWIGWRPLFRIAESQFLVAQRTRRPARLRVRPRSAAPSDGTDARQESRPCRTGAAAWRTSLGAGIVLCACAALIAMLVWPASRWSGSWNDLVLLHRLVVPTLANAIVLVSGYLAVASLAWGIADASMQQPLDLAAFDTAPPGSRRWRVAHLSDLHVVGERYGFRIESGRAGPRGNGRLDRVLAHLAAIPCGSTRSITSSSAAT